MDETQFITVRDKSISPCTHCNECVESKGKCSISDDMDEIYKALIEADGIIMANPAIDRLSLSAKYMKIYPADVFMPAPAQGALALECRSNDEELIASIECLTDHKASIEVASERAFSETLGGGCQAPIGVSAMISEKQFSISGIIASPDGTNLMKDSIICNEIPQNPREVGIELAKRMLANGGDKILSKIFERAGMKQ